MIGYSDPHLDCSPRCPSQQTLSRSHRRRHSRAPPCPPPPSPPLPSQTLKSPSCPPERERKTSTKGGRTPASCCRRTPRREGRSWKDQETRQRPQTFPANTNAATLLLMPPIIIFYFFQTPNSKRQIPIFQFPIYNFVIFFRFWLQPCAA